MALAVTPAEFLKVLWGESKGWAELTAISKTGVQSFPFQSPDSIESLLASSVNHNKTANVYMGVCLRREQWPRASGKKGPDGKPLFEFRGTEANALLSWVVWVEFDFASPEDGAGHKGRVVDPAQAKKWLAEFPLKPSIILRSGGGIQVYWLLKEPAEGDDLWRVKATNKALVEFFTTSIDGKKYGADTQSVDLARILRIPGSMNVKYTPPRPCEISWWKPENRYLLDDFDFLPIGEVHKPVQTPVAPVVQDGSPPPPIVSSTGDPRETPNIKLEPLKIQELGLLFAKIWFPGQIHYMALRAAGMMAHYGVDLESARTIIAAVCDATGSDTKKRVKDVEDTYRQYLTGGDVAGGPAIEKIITTELPEGSRSEPLRILNKIKKILPKPKVKKNSGDDGEDGDNGGADPDFEITKVIKFDSRPARYTVVIRKFDDPKIFEVPCDPTVITRIKLFREAFFENSENAFIANLKQRRWEEMLSAAPMELRSAPQEASLPGAIRSTLEDFLEQKKENPELGELKAFPGYNETEVFFSLRAFKGRLKDHGTKASDQAITEILRQDGWNDDRRWIGAKNPRVWFKLLNSPNGNGNGSGNGQHDGGGPDKGGKGGDGISPVKSVSKLPVDLFEADGVKKTSESAIEEKSAPATSVSTVPLPVAVGGAESGLASEPPDSLDSSDEPWKDETF